MPNRNSSTTPSSTTPNRQEQKHRNIKESDKFSKDMREEEYNYDYDDDRARNMKSWTDKDEKFERNKYQDYDEEGRRVDSNRRFATSDEDDKSLAKDQPHEGRMPLQGNRQSAYNDLDQDYEDYNTEGSRKVSSSKQQSDSFKKNR